MLKSPGSDGLTVEFYRVFWEDIKLLVINSFNEAFSEKELAETHNYSISKLLFKKNNREELKNYRPISLANIDYKLLANVLASRLHTVIGKLVSPEQTAYIRGRYIGENVRLLLDVIEYTKEKQIAGVALFLDFVKAFDSLKWNFFMKCLKKFKFKDSFCQWIQIIYSQCKASVNVNGYLTQTINMRRGIRQGCPLSGLLFILCAEFLCLHIKQANSYKGIDLDLGTNMMELKITQYADDTCLYLQNPKDIQSCLNIVREFSNVSGLYVNLEKTESLYLGRLEGQTPAVSPIRWPTEPIRYLGIYVGHNPITCNKLNWENKMEAFQRIIDNWRIRKLTIFGRVHICKTLALPKLVYAASLLPIPDGIVKRINKILFNFIWGCKGRVRRKTVINKVREGGLQMLDVDSHFLALKGAWIPRIVMNSHKIYAKLGRYYVDKIADITIIMKMNFHDFNAMPCLMHILSIYREIIMAYCRSNGPADIVSRSDLFNQCVWGNRNLMINNICLYSKSFISSNIIYVKDVLKDNGQMKQDMYNTLHSKMHYFTVMTHINTALGSYRNLRFQTGSLIQNDRTNIPRFLQTRDIYDRLVSQKVLPPKAEEK